MSTPSSSRSSAMGDEGPPRDQRPRSHRTNSRHNQEAMYLGNTEPPPLTCTVYGLMKDPYLPIAHCKTKARTPLMSHQRGNAIESPSYLT
ncbi:hypothetical protein CK203_003029 [Vitis vinifera]|uniref:Uncharacterized protein n=1 Tax=Vitis vinifera TaxID=29760 RepID=A0A438K795_VITVI|nr:hypothetical protein CK203_003029 [Vitis vinifera]